MTLDETLTCPACRRMWSSPPGQLPYPAAMGTVCTDTRHASYARARDARDQALRQVDEHADPEWKDRAFDALVRTARALPEFISDDVWTTGGLEGTRENRALGPVFRRALKEGVCMKTDRVRPSVRSHLSGKPIWISRLYGETSMETMLG